ncbi:MAG: acetolactate synthase [Phycisphaerae bacterium]
MAAPSFETADRPASGPVRQISVFLENRVGQLLRLLQVLQHGTSVKVRGLSIVHATDCAIVRLICDDTDAAKRILRDENFALSESDVLAVELPDTSALLMVCAALLSAEINISYIYPLFEQHSGRTVIAILCDDMTTAAAVLGHRKFRLVSEDDLGPGPAR